MINSPLLLDACVVSDMIRVNADVIPLVSHYAGAAYIPDVILDEIRKAFDIDDPADRGLYVMRTPSSLFINAALLKKNRGMGNLSANDCVCLLLAKAQSCICVTNDKALRNACLQMDVETMWELELMLSLFRANLISFSCAEKYVVDLQRENSRLKDSAVRDYLKQLALLKSEKYRSTQ